MVRGLSKHQSAFLFDCCVFIARFASSSCYSSAKTRIRLVKSYQLCWSTFVSNHGGRIELKRHRHMSLTSFEKLLSFIRKSLEVDSAMAQLRGGVIIPEIVLYCTLCYLAGGSYMDIFVVGISKPSFYCVVWKTMYAIVRCTNL